MAFSPDDIEAILEAHNKYRAAVGLQDLAWSDELAEGAQEWADHLADEEHALQHSGTAGENVASATTGSRAVAELVDLWGAEAAHFIAPCTFHGLEEGDPCSRTGDWRNVGHYSHYTQVVWKDTTEVGCGFAQDGGTGNDILVARYAPPGNVVGQDVY